MTGRIKKSKIFLFLISSLIFWKPCLSQYALDETGISFGGGTSLLGGSSIHLAPGLNADFFFSHYACGKRWGFQFEGGYRGTYSHLYGLEDLNPMPILIPNIIFHGIELGAYYKLRPHTYHRKKESGLLFGPKLSISGIYQVSGNGKDFFTANGGYVSPILPAIHLSGWFRRPFGEAQSIFIRPGAQIYLSPIYKVNGNHFSNYYLFLDIAITFWNNH